MIEISYPEQECCCACRNKAEIKIQVLQHGNNITLCNRCKLVLAEAIMMSEEDEDSMKN